MGKTVTTEFANRFPGETVNPHNPAHYPRRLVERLGRRGRRFPGPGGARHADRRLGDPSVGVLRRHRLQAELWRIQPQRHQIAMPQSRHARHHLPHDRGPAAAARGDPRRAAPRHRPRRVGAAHRSVPHAGLGARRRGDAGADREHRRATVGGRRAGLRDRFRAGIREHPRTPPPHLQFRGGAQLRLRIRAAPRAGQPGLARHGADPGARTAARRSMSRRSRRPRNSAAISTTSFPMSICC